MGDDRGAGRSPKPSAQATYTTRGRLLRNLDAIASAVAKTEVFNTLALNIEAIDRYCVSASRPVIRLMRYQYSIAEGCQRHTDYTASNQTS